MDIHKPRPAHSIREFVSEIGTITIGILIALGLEAAVEAYRNHELVEHARADLRYELNEDRDGLADTVRQEKGVVSALDTLALYGRRRLAGDKPGPPDPVTLSLIFKPMKMAAWDSTVATQALAHMPYAEAQAVSRAYAGSRNFNDFQADAIRHYFELSTLPDDLASASDAELKPVMREVALNRLYQGAVLQAGQGLLGIYDRALAALR
jgi:hypothetical protein